MESMPWEGTWEEDNSCIIILNKNQLTIHVTVIPLLGYSLFDGTMHDCICSVLSGWSFLDLTKWQFFRYSRHRQLVDNRDNTANQCPHLLGTFSYTSSAFWEMCLPPVLLVLYELMVGFVILMKTEFSVQLSMSLDLRFDPCKLLDQTSHGNVASG